MKSKGLHCNVYRNASSHTDTTNEGASFYHGRFTAIGADIDGVFEPSDDAPGMVIEKHQYGWRAIPLALYEDYKANRKCVMFGGNFLYTSDSRFPSDHPIKIFDRVEDWR